MKDRRLGALGRAQAAEVLDQAIQSDLSGQQPMLSDQRRALEDHDGEGHQIDQAQHAQDRESRQVVGGAWGGGHVAVGSVPGAAFRLPFRL